MRFRELLEQFNNIQDAMRVLGITDAQNKDSVKAAYRKLAMKYHPDRVTDPSAKTEATQKFQRLQAAFKYVMSSGQTDGQSDDWFSKFRKKAEADHEVTLDAWAKKYNVPPPIPGWKGTKEEWYNDWYKRRQAQYNQQYQQQATPNQSQQSSQGQRRQFTPNQNQQPQQNQQQATPNQQQQAQQYQDPSAAMNDMLNKGLKTTSDAYANAMKQGLDQFNFKAAPGIKPAPGIKK